MSVFARPGLMTSAAFCLILAGCQDATDAYRGKTITMSGAGVVVEDPFKPLDGAALATFIDASLPDGPVPTPVPDKTADDATQVMAAIGRFSKSLYAQGGPPTKSRQNQLRDARNSIQGLLMQTSANRCTAFQNLLRSRSTNTNFVLGSLATTLGTVGGVVSGGASQALSAAGGVASGVNAEYNKDILSNVTSTVIIPGIQKQRAAIQQEITNRRCLGVSSYNLTEALNDALRYHAACTTDVGVAAAGSALSQAGSGSSPTLSQAATTMAAVADLNSKMAAATQATAAAKPAAGKQPAKNPAPTPTTGTASTGTAPQAGTLVGDPISYLQCPSLNADGEINGASVPASAPATGQLQYGER